MLNTHTGLGHHQPERIAVSERPYSGVFTQNISLRVDLVSSWGGF